METTSLDVNRMPGAARRSWRWRPSRLDLWIIALLLAAGLSWWGWVISHTEIHLRAGGKALMLRAGFPGRDVCDLEIVQGRWRWHDRETKQSGELLVPVECAYNKRRNLRLEEHGKVYIVDKAKLDRCELRVVNGEWSYSAGLGWVSIFDLDVDPPDRE
jgi:hypothetical protein